MSGDLTGIMINTVDGPIQANENDLRAAGWVPAVLLTQERETSRRLQAALNRIVGFVSAEQAGWAIYDAEVSQ